MVKVYLFLAHGFEEIEGLCVVDILRRASIQVTTVSIEETLWILGSHNIRVEADVLFNETDFYDGTMFILPGGTVGTQRLQQFQPLLDLLLNLPQNVLLSAICAAPTVLAKAGLLKGVRATSHPSMKTRMTEFGVIYCEDTVVEAGRFLTSRGMGTSLDFALAVLAKLVSPDVVADVKKGIVLAE